MSDAIAGSKALPNAAPPKAAPRASFEPPQQSPTPPQAGPRASLDQLLRAAGPLAVAVSGGVDSLTLGVLAHRLTADVHLFHATSPAVPAEATERVRAWAAREGWQLQVVDAGEFADRDYRANPVNRCFFCKTNLYGAIRRISPRQIVSGANLDDLTEYRPGLDAAREHQVRHPYVEAGFDKRAVRALAAALGLGSVAELPSAPCLSSRVETGIAIDPGSLARIHAVERRVDAVLRPATVRCRLRADGVVIELDAATLSALDPVAIDSLTGEIRGIWRAGGAVDVAADAEANADAGADASAAALDPPIRFAPYRTGSAFLTKTLQPLKVLR